MRLHVLIIVLCKEALQCEGEMLLDGPEHGSTRRFVAKTLLRLVIVLLYWCVIDSQAENFMHTSINI